MSGCRHLRHADLTTTVVPASGASTVERTSVAADPPIDCSYVYPTVSIQPGVNATLHVDQAEASVARIQACTANSQFGCVIAYSSFERVPPADSLFTRPWLGVSRLSGSTSVAGLQVLCSNPADLAGNGATPLTPYFPTRSASGAAGMPNARW